ncbi:MAG: hypothetical protein ACRDD8_14280 [Bacteroidales bacterium]
MTDNLIDINKINELVKENGYVINLKKSREQSANGQYFYSFGLCRTPKDIYTVSLLIQGEEIVLSTIVNMYTHNNNDLSSGILTDSNQYIDEYEYITTDDGENKIAMYLISTISLDNDTDTILNSIVSNIVVLYERLKSALWFYDFTIVNDMALRTVHSSDKYVNLLLDKKMYIHDKYIKKIKYINK